MICNACKIPNKFSVNLVKSKNIIDIKNHLYKKIRFH